MSKTTVIRGRPMDSRSTSSTTMMSTGAPVADRCAGRRTEAPDQRPVVAALKPAAGTAVLAHRLDAGWQVPDPGAP